MEVRLCTPEDVPHLLQCASHDKDVYELGMFDSLEPYQKWILECYYNKKSFQVLVADDGNGIVGFLVWDLFQVYYKWLAYLHYIYVDPSFRKEEVSDKLVVEFIHNCFGSRAQRLKFDSKVLPSNWVGAVSSDAPLSEYTTFYAERSEELTEWFNTHIKPLKEI